MGLGKKIYIYSPNDEVNDRAATSAFYHLEEVEACAGTIVELVDSITASMRAGPAMHGTR